jgi:hypothetical protein
MSFSERIRPLEESDTFDENKDYYIPFSIHSLQNIEFNRKEMISIDLFGRTFYVSEGSEIIGNNDGNPLILNFRIDLYKILENCDRYSSNNYSFYFYVDPNDINFETASLRVFSKELDREHDIDVPINKFDLFCAA